MNRSGVMNDGARMFQCACFTAEGIGQPCIEQMYDGRTWNMPWSTPPSSRSIATDKAQRGTQSQVIGRSKGGMTTKGLYTNSPWSDFTRSIAERRIGRAMKAPESEEQPVVFIVDDDESLRDSLVRLFRMVGLRAEGFATAADFLKRKRPDVCSLVHRVRPTAGDQRALLSSRTHESGK
jgi:hypothetical protein